MAGLVDRAVKGFVTVVLGVVGFFVVLWGVIYLGAHLLNSSSEPDPAEQANNARLNVRYYGQQIARKALKDPDSARFSDLTVVKKKGTYALCGKVNSKNSFGGYTGDQLFLVVGQKVVFERQLKHNTFATVWNEFCTK